MVLVIIVILIILFIFTLHCHHHSKYIDLGNGISCKIDRHEYAHGSKPVHVHKHANQVKPVDEYLTSMPDTDDYHEFMVNTGLDKDILTSHRTFTDDLQNSTVGASAQSEFSHSDDIVPLHGLRRKSSYVPVSIHARDVPSLTTEQLQGNAQSSSSISRALFG